jgi:5-methylcytosine-specific restriction endonuclease McrA
MKNIEKKCFSLIQQIVTLRDMVCQRCGDFPISGHHVFSRRNQSTAFDPDSCLGLCADCHDGWARAYPEQAKYLLREKIGEARYNYLAVLSREIARLRERDYLNIAVNLGKKLAEMREND